MKTHLSHNILILDSKKREMIHAFYHKRINAAIDFIAAHLHDKLTLQKVAAEAGFSPFHFHRIFKSITGETLTCYIKRQRMEKASKMLRHETGKEINEVAAAAGYFSAANFSRDFKAFFGVTPQEYRFKTVPDKPFRKDMKTKQNLLYKGITFLNEKMVIYTRIHGGYNPEIISPAFEQLYLFARDQRLLQTDSQFIGIGYDDPDFTPTNKCRYDACMTLSEKPELPQETAFNTKKIASGRYAGFEFSGAKEEFAYAWDVIFRKWLIRSEYLPDDKPHLEIYGPKKQSGDTIFEAHLYLPVKPIKKWVRPRI